MTTRSEEIQKQKPKRTRMGRRNILTVSGLPDLDQFHYRWMKDTGARLQEALDAGYVFVMKSGLAAGDSTVESARGTDSLMKKGAGNGYEHLYLMKIPRELFDEDQATKQEEVDAAEAQMKNPKGLRGARGEDISYGSIKVSR